MQKWILAACAAATVGGAALPATAGNVGFYVNVAPPAVYREVVPAPRAGFVWVPGYWDWRYGRHHWIAGHWLRHRPGHHYVPARWHYRDGRYYYARGGWRDRDGDGVPNRFDRAPYDPRWR